MLDVGYVVVPALIVLIGILIAWLSIWRVLSLRNKTLPTWRKLSEGIVLSCIALIAIALASSSGFNAIAFHHFRSRPPGTIYLVNGQRMRMDCTGSGSPTIVLDAGLGNDGLIWGGVQPALAKTTRICSYDRAGFGWSDVLPPPRDADHIADELHGLLAAARIDGPIVLMGHSISGIYIREYATRYPANVAGLIFVDGATPLQNRDPAFKAEAGRESSPWYWTSMIKAAFVAGIPRLFGQCAQSFPGFEPAAAKLQAEDECHDRFRAIAEEVESFDRSGEEAAHTGPYGALPILILSQDTAKAAAEGEPRELGNA
jgi:pimeloyl-ACP methyl ester carboxylesterase